MVKDLKLFRILVILWGLSATFWDSFGYVLGYRPFNKSLVSLFQAQADYTCWKDFSLKFW